MIRLDPVSEIEYRYAQPPHLAVLQGVAAPKEKWFTIRDDASRARGGAGRTREKVADFAFNVSLQEVLVGKRDIKAFAEHNPTQIIGRTSNASLKLQETKRGLEY